mmetsp:Transcript_10117/g.15450  ORF Transcript_10117/g.15450 Transcript_10117/m.15450 type:complete len:81 (-) Transcript_10117:2139-2381(-)
MNYKQWDINTVTAADFTLQINLPEEVWQGWQNWKYVKAKAEEFNSSDEFSFKDYFMDQLEHQVGHISQQGKERCIKNCNH